MFVIADTHWFHDNIVHLCGRPANHDQLMIDRWNEVVQPDDLILHLGDVCHMKTANRERFRDEVAPQLNGRKLLILGNHDVRKPRRPDDEMDPGEQYFVSLPHREGEWVAREADVDFFRSCGFTLVNPFTIRLERELVTFGHYPREVQDGHTWHIHGHIHNNGYGPVDDQVDEQFRNINVSVEVVDYTPQLLMDLVTG